MLGSFTRIPEGPSSVMSLLSDRSVSGNRKTCQPRLTLEPPESRLLDSVPRRATVGIQHRAKSHRSSYTDLYPQSHTAIADSEAGQSPPPPSSRLCEDTQRQSRKESSAIVCERQSRKEPPLGKLISRCQVAGTKSWTSALRSWVDQPATVDMQEHLAHRLC